MRSAWAALLALGLPFGIALAVLLPLAAFQGRHITFSDVPAWMQGIGVPLAIFATFYVTRLSLRSQSQAQQQRQRNLKNLAIAYADEILAVFDEAEYWINSRQRLGKERFDILMEELRRFPVDQLDDANVAMEVYRLRNALAFYIPRYADLAGAPDGERSNQLRGKMAGCRTEAERARAVLQRSTA